MLASASGPLGALLMIAPLAAIPVFAVVGVPHFAPVAASNSDDEEISEIPDTSPAPVAATRPASRKSADDLFAPIKEPDGARPERPIARVPGSPARGRASQRDEDGTRERTVSVIPPDALDEWEVAPSDGDGGIDDVPARPDRDYRSPPVASESAARSRRTDTDAAELEPLEEPPASSAARKSRDRTRVEPDSNPRGSREFDPSLLDTSIDSPARMARNDAPTDLRGRANEPRGRRARAPENTNRLPQREALPGAPEQPGWRDAARRLKELGIRKYRLESQIEEQRFLFRCEYPTPQSPNVTELFEATADNPLDAVLEALRQIEAWLEQGDAPDRNPDE